MKLFWDLNDLELIYLIKEHNENAYNIMFDKYSIYIKKTIRDFNITSDLYDDYLQEGLIVLQDAINNYNDEYYNSFFKYFDLILKRRFSKLLKKDYQYKNHIIHLNEEKIQANTLNLEPVKYKAFDEIKFKNEFEKMVFEKIILENRQIKSFCEERNLNTKSVYNKVFRLKKRYKIK